MQVERIVVVGCGSIGRRHARNLLKRRDVILELCEPVDENLAKALDEAGDVPVHRCFAEMIATRPQAVVIATPHAMHAEQTIAALEAGAHVLCEKPMSDNPHDAEQMLRAARKANRVLDIGFTLHFHPALRRIKNMIDAGELGRVVHVHWHIGSYVTLENSVSRHQAMIYGALLMDYSHQPDLVYWWLGSAPVRVHASAVFARSLPLVAEPNVVNILLEYDAPICATIHLNYVQSPECATCEVIGDRGWVAFDMESGLLRHGSTSSEVPQVHQFDVAWDSLFEAEHDSFLRSMRGEREPESPPDAALQSVHIVDAAIKSLRSGGPIPVSGRTTCGS